MKIPHDERSDPSTGPLPSSGPDAIRTMNAALTIFQKIVDAMKASAKKEGGWLNPKTWNRNSDWNTGGKGSIW